MAYSCMNGRLRSLPYIGTYDAMVSDDSAKSHVSVAPFTLPHGFLSTHEISVSQDRTLVEVNRFKGEVIIDHQWIKTTKQPLNEGNEILVLAVLTRLKGQNATASLSGMGEDYVRNQRTLHVNWREHHDLTASTHRHSIDQAFPHRNSIIVPFPVTSMVMNTELLVLGSSVGVVAFKLLDLLTDVNEESSQNSESKNAYIKTRFDSIPSLRILKSFAIHAMDISASSFIAVSGDRLGVWTMSHILASFGADSAICVAEWSTKLEGRSRFTCARLSITNGEKDGSYIALTNLDGTAVVFRASGQGVQGWDRVTGPIENGEYISPIWECNSSTNKDDCSPCFVEIIKCKDTGDSTMAVVSESNSACFARAYDIETGSSVELIKSDKTEVENLQGIAALKNSPTGIFGFAFVDCNDNIIIFQIENIRMMLTSRGTSSRIETLNNRTIFL